MQALTIAMWGSLGLILWTHAGYPAAAGLAARVRRYAPRRDDAYAPSVALVIAAHDEEGAIGAKLENALALDYPPELLEVVVASDGSTDGTAAEVVRFAARGVRLLDLPRAGKVAAQDAAVRATRSEVVAFSDANTLWRPDALRELVACLADPEVGYVCGQLRFEQAGGDNREGLYWRYELWLRAQESGLGSITAGNGGIYAVRRSAYVELGAARSHDIGLPFRLRRRGLRSVYEPRARAVEGAAPTIGAEWGRKVRMLARAWWDVLRGGMLDPRGQPPVYYVELLSHRLVRYASGLLHAVLLVTSVALASSYAPAAVLAAAQGAWLLLALAGRVAPGRVPGAALAWYYLVVTAASVAALGRLAARGPQTTWRPAEGR